MNPLIVGTMTRQGGLITSEQAQGHGLSRREITRLVASGEWALVRRGVYGPAALVNAATSHPARRALLDRAGLLRVSMPHVVSHDSAALLLDLPVLRPRGRAYTHLTRPGVVGSHLVHGVKHHLAPLRAADVVEIDGRRVTAPARTALDVTREHGLVAGVCAIDSARRLGATPADLDAAVGIMKHWPHVRACREAIVLSDADSDSLGETLSRLLVMELGRGRPQTQFGMSADGRTAWADLRLHRHLIEFDGRGKYQRVEDGGLAGRPPAEVLFEEKQRQDWLQGFGLGMSRLTWDDVCGPGRVAGLARLAREYEQTCRLFGTDIADLARYRPIGPRPRPHAPFAGAA